MPIFEYVAKDKDGKTQSGRLEADDRSKLIESLRRQELIIISIEEVKGKEAKRASSSRGIKLDELVIFSRQLATMVDSGIPLLQALNILNEQTENKRFKATLAVVRSDVEGGSSFSEALSKHPNIFSTLFISMVRAGENSGMLDEILERLASYMEKANALQRKVRSSMVYPTVVCCMALLITLVLILKVIPTFKGIFATLGVPLPLLTQLLIKTSDFFRSNFIFLVAIFAGLIVILKRYIKRPAGRARFDRLILHLPIFGVLFNKVAVAKFSRTLSTLVKSGVPILKSMEIVEQAAGNMVIEKAINAARASVREGEHISEPLAKCGIFPPMVVRMIAVGEQTGELEKMLSKVADFYDEQVDSAVAGLTSIIEPLIIALLGIVIGGMVISMFLPIFKLTELVSR